jgi:hypothetical protein
MTDLPFTRTDGTSQRAILASIRAKEALRPKVDANGRPVGQVVEQRYDEYGALLPETEPPAS